MATNPELEAAIENDPGDEDAYLVYADWLQTQGDPRGELIAVQAAARRDPTDAELAKRVGELLARHDAVLLGELGEHMSVIWHLGFVRGVTLAPDRNVEVPLRALRDLLAHPSGRFVQSIAFAQPKGVDAKKVVKLLRELGRPVTLRELRLGGTFDVETDAPELRELFPRLHRPVDAEWRQLLGVLAKQRAMDLRYDAIDQLPKLVPLAGVEADGVTPEHVLLGLKVELEKRRPLGMVAALRRSFTAESLDAFVATLGEMFMRGGGHAGAKYGFQAIGSLGGPRAVTWIGANIGEWSPQRAQQGLELLAQIGSDEAVWELYALGIDPALHHGRRYDAHYQLEAVARRRGLDVDRLLDRTVPAVTAETTKLARLRVTTAAARRLEAHMLDGRRLPRRELLHYFARHPVIAPLARRVLWATYEGVDVETTFRLDGERALDAAGDEIDLEGALIGVLHPAELPADDRKPTLKEWSEVFSDESIEPLFSQLDREVHDLKPNERGAMLTRYKLRTVGFEQLKSRFHELDWEPERAERDEDMMGGALIVGYRKRFPRDDVWASASIEGGAITEIGLAGNRRDITFASIHPVTASEILAAAEHVVRRESAAPADSGDIGKGTWVQIARGANRLREGYVFWIGDGSKGPRVGIKTDDDETLWANLADVRKTTRGAGAADDDDDDEPRADADGEQDAAAQFLAAHDPKPPPPLAKGTLAKGTQVRWTKGRNTGTGVVFWIGKNKFGDGMRAGVKDDETGETVWADADDCEPV